MAEAEQGMERKGEVEMKLEVTACEQVGPTLGFPNWLCPVWLPRSHQEVPGLLPMS